jgi:hypothetical protein
MCCGRGKTHSVGQLKPQPVVNRLVNHAFVPAQKPAPVSGGAGVIFEYVGQTGLTVTGPVSGGSYRFDRPGARQAVDARDRAALANIQVLRAVS